VSSSGNDGNECRTESTPCATFQRAHEFVPNGGTIVCLSSGDFGAATITKSVTIECRGHVAKSNGLTVNAPDVVVILRGLHLYGYYQSVGRAGVEFLDGNAVHVDECHIAGWPVGIKFTPTALSRLYVTDSVISENGLPDNSGGGGIFVVPTGSGAARVVLKRTTLSQNTLGIVVDGTGSSARSVVEVNDSVVGGSIRNGITVNQAGMVINRTSVLGNLGNGILSGPGALVHIGSSTVAANSLGGLAYNGGQIFSYQDNETMGNGIDRAPSGVLTVN
jgi:hypothetical protein